MAARTRKQVSFLFVGFFLNASNMSNSKIDPRNISIIQIPPVAVTVPMAAIICYTCRITPLMCALQRAACLAS